MVPDVQEEAVQLWAVWAIHHVCTKNPGRYCHMLSSQGGQVILLALVREPATHHVVANITDQVTCCVGTYR
jgi:Zyg-11 family protein